MFIIKRDTWYYYYGESDKFGYQNWVQHVRHARKFMTRERAQEALKDAIAENPDCNCRIIELDNDQNPYSDYDRAMGGIA